MAEFRISNELGASVFAVLSGLTALSFTAWIFGAGGCSSTTHPKISPVPAPQVEQLKDELAEESARRAELALKLKESQEVIRSLSDKASALQSRWKEANVPGLRSNIKELEAKLGEANTSEQALREKNSALEAKIATLTAEAGTADTDGLKKKVESLQNQLDEEKKDCAAAKKALETEINTLKSSLDQAKYGEQLKRAVEFPALDLPLLVNDPAKLDPAVRPLFIRLRSMGDTPDDREIVYAELAKEGQTEAMHLVPFTSGSAEVVEGEKTKLSEKLGASEGGAKYLVVGYASVDGEAKQNYELSSERASNVAQQIVELAKAEGKDVQAVYFGQTKRFSTSDLPPNRVVEVWRVK